MRLGIERDCSDKNRQNPLGRVVSGHNRRAYLDDEPGNHCVAEPDAIHFPLFQLTEEGAHRDPRRLRSIGYSRHSVELRSGSVTSLLPGPHGFESRRLHKIFRWKNDRVPLRIAENTFRTGFGELEGAEVRQQSGMVIAGGISVLSSCAKIGEATAITSAKPNENVMSFVFSFIPLPLLLKL